MDYAIIGDVHSDYKKLKQAFDYAGNHNLQIILLGDLFDSRCQYSDSVAVYDLVRSSNAITLQSNHQDKLIRYLMGNSVVLNNGLDVTVKEFEESNIDKNELLDWLLSFPYGIVFKTKEGHEMRCCHAYFSSKIEIPEYKNYYLITESQMTKTTKSLMLYGPTSRENKNERVRWWENPRHKNYTMVSGHYHTVHIDSKCLVLDGGCGGPEEPNCLCLYDTSHNLLKRFF